MNSMNTIHFRAIWRIQNQHTFYYPIFFWPRRFIASTVESLLFVALMSRTSIQMYFYPWLGGVMCPMPDMMDGKFYHVDVDECVFVVYLQ